MILTQHKSKVAIALALASFGMAEVIYHTGEAAHAASPAQTVPGVVSPDQITGHEVDDLALARAGMQRRNFNLAMSYLERRLDRSPGAGDALALMTTCVRTMADEACSHGDQLQAGALLSQLSARLLAARQARFQPDATSTPLDDLVATERDVRQINDSITASADNQAGPHIDEALRLADAAHHGWYTCRFNNRDKVREGLRELRWVHERGPAISAETLGRYFQAMDRLKGLVADAEWEPLRMEAGYAQKEVSQ